MTKLITHFLVREQKTTHLHTKQFKAMVAQVLNSKLKTNISVLSTHWTTTTKTKQKGFKIVYDASRSFICKFCLQGKQPCAHQHCFFTKFKLYIHNFKLYIYNFKLYIYNVSVILNHHKDEGVARFPGSNQETPTKVII